MHMYRIVLAEGQLGDVTTYLNRDLLVSQWPVLRTLISKTVPGRLGVHFPRTTRRATNRAMNLNALHRRLMQDVLEIGNSLPLVITGGYAVQAHQLFDLLSRDIDVATDSDIPMEDIVAAVMAG